MKPNLNLLTMDYPDLPPITEEVRRKNADRRFTGGVRINQGRYRTEEETRVRRERSLNAPLP